MREEESVATTGAVVVGAVVATEDGAHSVPAGVVPAGVVKAGTGAGARRRGRPAAARSTRGAEDEAELHASTWTSARWSAFFDHFAMTGQVANAAAAAGMTAKDAYAMRRRSTRFALMWRRALDVGYDRLEVAVLRQVLGQTETKLDVGAAMLLLERHRATIAVEQSPSRRRRPPDAAAARAKAERELLKRLQAFARRAGSAEPA
ncbi:hypothetical protein ASE95_11695 [Sphingomonas sp. Leaf231]|uniref:hypothetical protein n=1 Tax=Sphingomonas sp. Leaf231 TaxID=1736301 RepID=UPI0006FF2E7A|nr:hypothetical protein [Sphingomonas sp. Leaf231]KQN90939.1 hypothetical protein ASE95_11695 [Sphingomonas sp. Leaf231]